jgi:hypothetical protein
MPEEISIFDFIDTETPVGVPLVPPAESQRTLLFFAAERKLMREEYLTRLLPERLFATSYERIENGWLLELTREAAGALAAYVREANVGAGALIISQN